jgi:hypothetical protein
MNFVAMVKEYLNRFRDMLGLAANFDKSCLFTCGVAGHVKNQMLGILGYQQGKLPMRYLGIPLISSRLKKADCALLAERIATKAKSWASKALSHAGRLELINSNLFAM